MKNDENECSALTPLLSGELVNRDVVILLDCFPLDSPETTLVAAAYFGDPKDPNAFIPDVCEGNTRIRIECTVEVPIKKGKEFHSRVSGDDVKTAVESR